MKRNIEDLYIQKTESLLELLLEKGPEKKEIEFVPVYSRFELDSKSQVTEVTNDPKNNPVKTDIYRLTNYGREYVIKEYERLKWYKGKIPESVYNSLLKAIVVETRTHSSVETFLSFDKPWEWFIDNDIQITPIMLHVAYGCGGVKSRLDLWKEKVYDNVTGPDNFNRLGKFVAEELNCDPAWSTILEAYLVFFMPGTNHDLNKELYSLVDNKAIWRYIWAHRSEILTDYPVKEYY